MLTVKSDKEFSIGIVKEYGDIPTLKAEIKAVNFLTLLTVL